ncbi:MAG: glycosyltransferase, partial [Thermoanaerobaculia bacterium]
MKTAAIVYEFPCHSETFVVGQIRGLIELGCDVRIFADNADTVAVAENESAQSDLLDRVTYFGLPFKQLRESVGRWQSRRPASPDQATTHRPARRLKETAEAGLRLRIEGRAFGRNSRFDVIHAHFGPNGVRAIRLRKMDVLRGPTLTSFYGYDVGRHWSRSGYSHLFAEGDSFIALSNHMRTALIALGAPEERTIVHPLGIHVEQFKPATQKSGTRFEILSVARLIPKKGIEYALRAVAELSRQGIEIHYIVVGGGPLRERLESLA